MTTWEEAMERLETVRSVDYELPHDDDLSYSESLATIRKHISKAEQERDELLGERLQTLAEVHRAERRIEEVEALLHRWKRIYERTAPDDANPSDPEWSIWQDTGTFLNQETKNDRQAHENDRDRMRPLNDPKRWIPNQAGL
jgi:chromosome segregation ATPase